MDSRTDTLILTPLERMDQTLAQEFAKGEIAGIRMLVQLPKTLVEQAEQFIKERGQDESVDE